MKSKSSKKRSRDKIIVAVDEHVKGELKEGQGHDDPSRNQNKVTVGGITESKYQLEPEGGRRKKTKRRKRKKRKVDNTESAVSEFSNNTSSAIEEHDVLCTNDEVDKERPASPILEGSVTADGQLVLIDRVAGKVYSLTERLENGKRKQIGEFDANGQIILHSECNATPTASTDAEGWDRASPKAIANEPSTVSFPFETDPDDHCESPLTAYEHILPVLRSLDRRIQQNHHPSNQKHNKLCIYDPYYCNGQVARHLNELGFPNVYNRKEDCYEVWNDPIRYQSIQYDVLITNPPYSGDHVERLIRHVTSPANRSKPWMLLLPTYVHKKDYFQQLTSSSGQQPIYLVPHKRYVYEPPPNFRMKKVSDTHKKSSPFVSMWYCWGGTQDVTDDWYRTLQATQSHTTLDPKGAGRPDGRPGTPAETKAGTYSVARSKSGLRDLRRRQK